VHEPAPPPPRPSAQPGPRPAPPPPRAAAPPARPSPVAPAAEPPRVAVKANAAPAPGPAAPPLPSAAPAAPPVVAAPAATPAPVDDGRPSALRIGAFTAFGLAAVSVLATVSFTYYATLEGPRGTTSSYTCNAADPQHSCPKIYSGNTGPAVTFGVLAAASAVTGGLLLYYDLRRHKRPPATVMAAPLPGGFGVAGSLEF